MRILGSAAAEGIPALFCNCLVCRIAWERGGKELRMRSAYQINERIRIDLGPDSYAQELRFGLHSENLRHLFISHSHEDHFYPELLDYRMPGFSVVAPENMLHLYGNIGVMRALNRHMWEKSHGYFDGDYTKFRLNPVRLRNFEPVELPDEDMTFYPLPANHFFRDTEQPHFFLFRSGKKYAMIANDTGYFDESVWRFLQEKAFRLDLVISDCTGGLRDLRDGHMSGSFVLDTKKRLEETGAVNPNTRYVINHFSHNGNATHTVLETYYNQHGIEVGFDGMEIDF